MPGIDIEQIFTADSQSVFDFLTVDGQGCYVPAYQRPYAWDTDNVFRLLEDATLGLELLAADESSIRFIGTVIAIQGHALITVQPPMDRELPPRVLTIIDGQQRICTLLILNILLHDALSACIRSMQEDVSQTVVWLRDDTEDFLEELSKTFRFVGRGARARDVHHYYPRIIRAYDDQWARAAPSARYTSPVGRFVWEYIQHIEGGVAVTFAYRPVDEDDNLIEDHEPVLEVVDFLREQLDQLAQATHGNLKLPEIAALLEGQHFNAELWSHIFPAHLIGFIRDEGGHPLFQTVLQTLRLSALARFINNRMAATVVVTRAEDHAFDMFESLNTTGQPLTAFETFKPKVIEAEGLAAYEMSISKTHIDKVLAYLERFKRAEERQNATSTLMVPFALVENGQKLEKHLNAQRRYLRDAYARANDIVAKRAFTRSLSDTASFIGTAWKPLRRQAPQLLPLAAARNDQAEFCLEALRDLRHDVAIAPIARFYASYLSAAPAQKANAAIEFYAAVEAVTAFSMLWRANHGGTANIDGIYRDIMLRGVPGVPPLSRQAPGAAGTPSATNLRTALKHHLAQANVDRATWVRNASLLPIYRLNKTVTRFLLFVASHDAYPDEVNLGLIERGRSGTNTMLNREQWNSSVNLTVEHIAPEAPSPGWPDDVYEDQRTVQRLGNLILLPEAENNFIANRPWVQKQVLYRLFSARTVAQARAAMRQANRFGFNPGKTANVLVEESMHLPMCLAIGQFDGEWNEAFIAQRSTRIAELAWRRLWTWLEPTPARVRRTPGRA